MLWAALSRQRTITELRPRDARDSETNGVVYDKADNKMLNDRKG